MKRVGLGCCLFVQTLLFACAEPPKAKTVVEAEPEPTEAEAKVAFEKAKLAKDYTALVAVFEKFGKFPSGKAAIREAFQRLSPKVKEHLEKCEIKEAESSMAPVAALAAEDSEISTKYDELQTEKSDVHMKCLLASLDKDIAQAEASMEWPHVFTQLRSVKRVDKGEIEKRLQPLFERWKQFVTKTLDQIISKKSVKSVLGENQEKFAEAIKEANVHPLLASDAVQYNKILAGANLVFEKMGGELLPAPKKYWTYGFPLPRKPETPEVAEGKKLGHAVEFRAIGKGKIKGVKFLIVGEPKKTVYERLSNITMLISEIEAKPYNTKVSASSTPSDAVDLGGN